MVEEGLRCVVGCCLDELVIITLRRSGGDDALAAFDDGLLHGNGPVDSVKFMVETWEFGQCE